jgi:hypothetical protein
LNAGRAIPNDDAHFAALFDLYAALLLRAESMERAA